MHIVDKINTAIFISLKKITPNAIKTSPKNLQLKIGGKKRSRDFGNYKGGSEKKYLNEHRAIACGQCSGSMKFWGGSGSGSADPCI